jgi:hypothetical protein
MAEPTGLDALVGQQVQVWIPGHATNIFWRGGELSLDKNVDGTIRALVLTNSAGRQIVVAWGAGVIIEPAS